MDDMSRVTDGNETLDKPAFPSYSLRQLCQYALRLGATGFGGPVALVGYMHRDLVEQRKWISEAEYKEGLTLAQLMPGPLAAQLAIYLGYVHYGVLGATVIGFAFILPSFLMVVALGWAYKNYYDSMGWMQAAFYGVGACVIGIISLSAYKLAKKTIGTDWLLAAIALVSASVTFVTRSEYVVLFLVAGILVWLVRLRPKINRNAAMSLLFPIGLFLPSATGGDTSGTLWKLALFFTKAGAFVFGSGLAIVPFLRSGVVEEYHWMDKAQFLDAVAVAMITPGPVVITAGFIGYYVAGFPGALVAALGTFLPCYFFTIVPAPYFRKYGKRPAIVAFVDGVTAAAVGAIIGAVVVMAGDTIFPDSWTPNVFKLAVAIVSVGLLLKFKKLPEPILVLAAAGLGMLVQLPKF